MSDQTVRAEREISTFSRGAELAKAIRKMWDLNEPAKTPYGPDRNTVIAERIEALMAEFDLTYDEWYYWARLCAKREA